MRICWDNLENLRITKRGYFLKNTTVYMEIGSCKRCGEPYLTEKSRPSLFCSHSCSRIGKRCSDETKKLLSFLNAGSKNPRHGVRVSDKTKHLMSIKKQGSSHPLYGKTHSEESKRKMAEARKRVVFSKEWREHLSAARKGKKNPFYGKKHSDETRHKLSLYAGPLSSGWKGGISTEPYCLNWTREFKEYIKERDEYRCMNPDCWKNSVRLCVHHIDYDKKSCSPANLITLCASCNARANRDRDYYKNYYQSIMRERYNFNY